MTGYWNGEQIMELLEKLDNELRQRGARALLYLIGGARMALSFDRKRRTKDIDAIIRTGHGPVTTATREIGRRECITETCTVRTEGRTTGQKTPRGGASKGTSQRLKPRRASVVCGSRSA